MKLVTKVLCGVCLSFLSTPNLFADDFLVPQLGGKGELSSFYETVNETYQIGDEWGKLPFSEESFETDDIYQKVTLATAKVGGATGFYIGKFAGEYVMGTNNHVMSGRYQCSRVTFPVENKTFKCKKFLGTWKKLDLTLFTIKVTKDQDIEYFEKLDNNFSFHSPIEVETPLITAGFGVAENRSRSMMVNQDSDCISFSSTGDYQLMGDPDDLNPGPNKVWSFANGCDVSHGDSGSAMFNRNTGEIVGLIWTGRIPKDASVQKSDYLREILDENNSKEIWQQLSYAVPAEKIKDVLTQELEAGKHSSTTKTILENMLNK